MSDDSNSLVQERPAWLIPVVLIAGILVFSAVFAYYYFGPTPSEILGLDPRASESSDRVDIIIGDRQFLIPSNYTRYPLQRVGGTQDEIDLHALLPELSPYSAQRREAFEDNSASSSLLHIKIHKANDLLPATERLDNIYARHLSSRTAQPGPTGLEQFSFSERSGYRDQELFVANRSSDTPLLITCFHETKIIFSPNCTRTFHLTDQVAITYRYKRRYIESWKAIDSSVIALINSFIVEDEPNLDGAEPEPSPL